MFFLPIFCHRILKGVFSCFILSAKPLPSWREPPTSPTAPRIIGGVHLGAEANIWYNAVLRADNAPILVGPRTNLQDGCIVHTDCGQPCRVGEGVTVGHGAILHACTVENNCTIGMGAIVLNGAVIGENSIVGAGALVTKTLSSRRAA